MKISYEAEVTSIRKEGEDKFFSRVSWKGDTEWYCNDSITVGIRLELGQKVLVTVEIPEAQDEPLTDERVERLKQVTQLKQVALSATS